jgi:phosphoribosylaminoimidazole carboxylase PurK protein
MATSSSSIDRHVGCLGGGQLGRMMAEAACRMGIKMTTLDPLGVGSPMGAVCGHAVTGAFTDAAKIRELASMVDVVTVEIEHVDAAGLAKLEAEGTAVHPSPATIALVQDKLLQKQHLSGVDGVALGDYCDVPDVAALLAAGERWGYPLMLKARRLAYDGRGNLPVKAASEAASAFASLSQDGKAALYAEKWCDFEKELAVMVARSASGRVEAYPVVETVQLDSMCHTVVAPAQIPRAAATAATTVALAAIASLSGGGIFGVELFQCRDGSVLLNEIAPRPHNSGHYTQDGLSARSAPEPTDEASLTGPHLAGTPPPRMGSHLAWDPTSCAAPPHETPPHVGPHRMGRHRHLPLVVRRLPNHTCVCVVAVCGSAITVGSCVTDQFEQHLRCVLDLPLGSTALRVPAAGMLNVIGTADGLLATTARPLTRAIAMRDAHVHWYGKAPPKARRKMGHINVSGASVAAVNAQIEALLRDDEDDAVPPAPAEPESTTGGAKRKRTASAAPPAAAPPAAAPLVPPKVKVVPLVGVIMGSDSDLPTMRAAAEVLESFDVPYEITVVSAHRTPQRMYD